MLTTWGKKIVACAKAFGSYCIPSVNVANDSTAYIAAKTIGNTNVYIPPMYSSGGTVGAITSALSETGTTTGVAFGSDGTTATESDYMLGNQITGFTVPSTPTVETIFDSINFRYVARVDYAISNNTGSDITIREVGLFSRFKTATTRGGTPSSSARRICMLDRTVLDSPVVIPNGTAGVVRYEFAYEG